MLTKRKITAALRVIKEVCTYHQAPCGGGCYSCPLSKNGTCVLEYTMPQYLKIVDDYWRATENE